MKRGEIRWYTFREPDMKRPVLILTRDAILEYLRQERSDPNQNHSQILSLLSHQSKNNIRFLFHQRQLFYHV